MRHKESQAAHSGSGDQLASLARAKATMAGPASIPEHRALVTVPALPRAAGLTSAADMPDAIATPGRESASSQVRLAPGLAAVSTIAMSITMGYMLLLML